MSADSSSRSAVDYYFEPYRFDGRRRSLYRDDELVPLTPKAADTLVALIERAGHVVEKDELLRVVWGEIAVGDDTLAQNISTLRRALGDDASRPRFIATVPRHGYRFVARVHAVPATTAANVVRPSVEATAAAESASAAKMPGVGVVALVVISVAIAVAGTFVARRLSVAHRSNPLVEFTVTEPEHRRFSTSGQMFALSPNGEYLAFIALDGNGSSSLWLRPLGSAIARVLEGTQGADQPFWSPDSGTIAFFAERRLKTVDVVSGLVHVVASLSSPRSMGGTWSRRGQILFSVPSDGMYVVPASGGVPERLTPAPDTECGGCGAWPDFLPDGRRFLYTMVGPGASGSGIYVGELGKSDGRRLLDAVSSSTFVAPGLLSFARFGTLYVQRFDTGRLRPTGEPVPVADRVAYNARTGRVQASLSETGVMAFREPLTTELVWVDRAGQQQNAAAPPATYLNFAIAPDGRRVAVARVDPRTGTSDVWILDEGRELRVTDDPGWDGDPVWSKDGLYVMYSSQRGGRWRIYRRQAAATGPEEMLLDSDTAVTPLQALRAMQVMYAARGATAPFDLWTLASARSTPLMRVGGYYPSDARLSPDERWLAFGIPETSNSWEQALYVSATSSEENRRAIAEAASMPRWRADGHELFYLSRESSIVAIPIDPERTPSDAGGRVLFRASDLAHSGISGGVYDVTPDGQRFLLKREVASSPIHVVLNWDARLGR